MRWIFRTAVAVGVAAAISVPASAIAWPGGDTAPERTISGTLTQLITPLGIDIDSQGFIYVANRSADSIIVFAPTASGDVAPVRELRGPSTLLSFPTGVALDSADNLYVANSLGAITRYDAGWASGDTAPSHVIEGPTSLVSSPIDLAVTASGDLYVSNLGNSTLTMYSAGSGWDDVAPTKSLSGPNTFLSEGAFNITVDAADNVYVTAGSAVHMWADGWASGNTAPTKTLTGPNTGLSSFPRGLAVRDGLLYVADQNGGAVRVYSASWSAPDTAPTKELSGPATGLLSGPIGVTFNSAGQMFVSLGTASRLLVFSAEGPAPTMAISVKRGTSSKSTLRITGRTTGLSEGTVVSVCVKPAGATACTPVGPAAVNANGKFSATGRAPRKAYVYAVVDGLRARAIVPRP